ncbi:polymerase [Trichonephila clavipes]|nr:polymerase [Trichonephila clavipes]
MCVIEWRREKWLLPRPFILQMHNKIADLVGIFLHSAMSTTVAHGEKFSETVKAFVSELCTLHIQYPNRFFDIANSIEGLCVGALLKRTEQWVNDELWVNLLNEIESETFLNLRNHPIVKILETTDIDNICELGCLTKITGHPLTDIEKGSEKLQSRVQEEFPVSVNAIAFCISSFKENFIRNFILKHKRWPMVTFDPTLVHPAIHYSYPRGIDPTGREVEKIHGRMNWEDWNMVDLGNEMKFNYCNHIIPPTSKRFSGTFT